MKSNIIRQYYLVFVITVFGLLLSTGSTLFLLYREYIRTNESFRHDSMERIKTIEQAIRNNTLALKSTRNFFNASTIVTRDDFDTFTNSFFLELPGIQAFEWIPRIRQEELESYIKKAKEDGFTNFQLTQRNEQKQFVPVTKREIHFPVYYINPLKGNEAAFGFDLASSPPRLEALIKAAGENRLVATAPITLVQEQSNSYGFLLIIPVFEQHSATASAGVQLDAVQGFVLAVFRVEDIVNDSLAKLKPLGIDIVLSDNTVSGQETPLYIHLSRLSKGESPYTIADLKKRVDSSSLKHNIDVGGRRWQIETFPTSIYIKERRTALPWFTGISILLLTITTALFVKRKKEEHERIRHLVEERTRELNESKTRLDLAIEGAELGLWDWNIQSGDVFFNERWAAMLDYRLEEIVPRVESWGELLHPDDKEEVYAELNAYLEGHAPFYKTKHRLKTKSGGWKWVLDTGKIVERDGEGKPLRATGIHLDITESKEYEEKLEKLTVTDSLTQLYNRVKLHSELHREIERAQRYSTDLSLIMFDIDHFKSINDNYGHDVGDEILIMVSSQVKDNVRKIDVVARWGGEEFMILAPNTAIEMAARLAEKLRAILEKSYSASNRCVTASFGVTELAPGEGFDSFTKRVDDALYKAKRGGRNRVITLAPQRSDG